MNEKERQELEKAITSLSEKDQLEIAGGQKITDEQCEKLKRITTIAIGYGCPYPLTFSPHLTKTEDTAKEALKRIRQNFPEKEDDKPKENSEI